MSRKRQAFSIMWLLLLVAAFSLTGCGDDDPVTPPEDASLVTGVVLDAQGAPVAGAGLVVEYETGMRGRPSTQVNFTVPAAGQVKLWVMGPCSEDTVRVLWDGPAPAGELMVTWDGRDQDGRRLPDQLFTVHTLTGGESTSLEVMLMLGGDYPEDADPAEWAVQATSDADGRFSLDQECLALGHVFTRTDETGQVIDSYTIPRRLRVHAMHAGHPAAHTDWVDVDPETGAAVTLNFSR